MDVAKLGQKLNNKKKKKKRKKKKKIEKQNRPAVIWLQLWTDEKKNRTEPIGKSLSTIWK